MPTSPKRRRQVRYEVRNKFRIGISNAIAGKQTTLNWNQLSKNLGYIWASLTPEQRHSCGWTYKELLLSIAEDIDNAN
ncbi:6404_t:CDS:2 [Paraglomus brasilianum]|uniref:6404_t:CDS:1 n=1 Tax=Paraglomus brasilianum TaxID=144538 RepID=A0A9N9B982_9GLOM|nr:6404_t:CDS:2 [Paraglomus brasilianum]